MCNWTMKLCLAAMMFTATAAGAAVQNDQMAPDFILPDTYEQEHALSDYKGKYVVLEWLNHDCPFVRKHYDSGNMQGLQKKWTDQGVVWLSINSSAHDKQGHYHPEEANKLTAEKSASPTALLLDFEGEVGQLYGAQTTPHMYIINPEGVLVYQGAIDSNPSFDPSDIPSADNYVDSALTSLMSGGSVAVPTSKAYGCSVKY